MAALLASVACSSSDESNGAIEVRCGGKTGTTGDIIVALTTSTGDARQARVHVPSSYDPTKGTMLVLNLHGLAWNAQQQEDMSHMVQVADERGFIAVHPEGLEGDISTSWNAGACCLNAHDDVGFIRELVAKLENDFCIDPKRVFSTGMSNGAMMSYRLACEASDLIAAIAPVAGATTISPETCKPKRAVPVIHFHGTKDPLVPYDGGLDGILRLVTFPSVSESVGLWRNFDGCPDTSRQVFSKGDAKCEAWSPCDQGSAVELCTIQDGGHTWPGGAPPPPFNLRTPLSLDLGKTSTDIDASRILVDFFEKHPMP